MPAARRLLDIHVSANGRVAVMVKIGRCDMRWEFRRAPTKRAVPDRLSATR